MRKHGRKHVNVTLTFVMECRVCLSSAVPDLLVSLCGVLSHKIMCCTSITIEPNNRLPTHICPTCVERLNASYDFKVLCEHSDYVLRKRIQSEDCIPKLEPSDDVECNRIFELAQPNSKGVHETDLSNARNVPNYIISSSKQSIKIEEVKIDNGPIVETHIISDDNHGSSEDDFDSREDSIKISSDKDRISCDSKPMKNKKPQKMTTKTLKSRNSTHNLENNMIRAVRSRSERMAKKIKLKNFQDTSDDADIKKSVYSKEIKHKVIQKNKLNGASREQCSICGKTVSTKFRLKMHLRTHTGEKPFSCRYCEKTFGTAQNLKVHERVHTGEKPLLCGTCGKAFAQSAGLVAHMRLHTGEMPYKCTLCPSSFRTPGHLQYHIKQHTGEKSHECVNCKKAFISRGDLTQHMKIHTGERPYVCSVCGFRMARSGHLHRHMKIHTGEKPHKCHTCDNSFVQKGDLVRHMKKHLKSNTCKMEKIPKH